MLKSGSPYMCVGDVRKKSGLGISEIDFVYCTWYDQDKKEFQSYAFKPEQLIYAVTSNVNASNAASNVAST